MRDRAGRIANVVLGAWLLISAFVWHHNKGQFLVTWITGILIIAVALASLAAQRARFVNGLLGLWLFVSAFAFKPVALGTFWNNVLVGIVVAGIALAGASTAAPRSRARVPS